MPLVLPLAAFLRELAAALEVGVVELVLGGLVRHGDLEDLRRGSRRSGRGSPRRTRASNLGFEGVGLVDERLDPLQLALVRVDELGERSMGAEV